jgi:hypothetical protein
VPGELRVVLLSAITTGQAVVAVRCLTGEAAVGDWVEHLADSPQPPTPIRAEVMSIMRFTVEVSDDELVRSGSDGPDGYQALDHEEADVLGAGGAAIVLLTGRVSGLDNGRLVIVRR